MQKENEARLSQSGCSLFAAAKYGISCFGVVFSAFFIAFRWLSLFRRNETVSIGFIVPNLK